MKQRMLVCLEPDDPGPAWLPFAGARPLADLRTGAWRTRERWAGILGLESVRIMGGPADTFADAESVAGVPRGPVVGPAVVARSDFAPAGTALSPGPGVRRLAHEGLTVGWIVPEGETWTAPHEQGEALAIDGVLLHGAHDLVTALEHLLPADCVSALAADPDRVPGGCIILGDPGDVACFGALVEPGVVFDVRAGVVVLEEGVYARSGARLEGPLYIGPHTHVQGGAIRYSAVGPSCRIHGEIASSVFLGYANKSHDGFLGHSVVGQWANLGAGTITSNLKNTYGDVRLDLPGGRLDTGRMNFGTLFGDHVKTGIGTLLSTGTVIGTGANVVGNPVPRWVPPFTWPGEAGEEAAERRLMDQEAFVRIAGRVMPRRKIEVTPQVEASLRAIHRRLAR